MKTNFATVLVSLAASAIVNAIPLPQPNYDPTLQIPQSVFDFQKPNILTRSEKIWSDGTEFVMSSSEPEPLAPQPHQPPENDHLQYPSGKDNQEPVPKKDSGLPFFSKPDVPDTTNSQPPEVYPSNKSPGRLDWFLNLLLPDSW